MSHKGLRKIIVFSLMFSIIIIIIYYSLLPRRAYASRISTNYPQIHWALPSELTIVLEPLTIELCYYWEIGFPPFMSSLPSCPPSLHVLPPFMSFFPLCPHSLCVLPPFVSFLPSCPSFLHAHWWGRACPSLLTWQFPLFLLGQSIVPLPPSPLIWFLLMKSNIFCHRCCPRCCSTSSSSSSNIFPRWD